MLCWALTPINPSAGSRSSILLSPSATMETQQDRARRRLQQIAQQVAPSQTPQLERSRTSAAASSSSPSSYASASGQPNSYARVHGQVSRAPAIWRSIPVVCKEELQDVKYEKAVGEGIAKVRPNSR